MALMLLKDTQLLLTLTLTLTLVIWQFQPASARGGRLQEDDASSADDDDESTGGTLLKHTNLIDSHPGSRLRQPKSSWLSARRQCRSKGGLARISSAEDDKSIMVLAARTRDLQPGCYWIAADSSASTEELRWLVDNPHHRDTGCLCVNAGGKKVSDDRQPRLHIESCKRHLPFLCQQQFERRRRPTGSTTPTRARVAPARASITTTAAIEFVPDTVDDSSSESSMDSPEDHGKNQPLAEGEGVLNPWGTSVTTTRRGLSTAHPAVMNVTTPAGSASINATGGDSDESVRGGNLRLLSSNQRSEFITLVVLYSIVGVVCLVLLALCLVRCCRGFCGRASIRYVKHVDEDDIPRFMPSSWA